MLANVKRAVFARINLANAVDKRLAEKAAKTLHALLFIIPKMQKTINPKNAICAKKHFVLVAKTQKKQNAARISAKKQRRRAFCLLCAVIFID